MFDNPKIGDKVRIVHSQGLYGFIVKLNEIDCEIEITIEYKMYEVGDVVSRKYSMIDHINKIEEYLYF